MANIVASKKLAYGHTVCIREKFVAQESDSRTLDKVIVRLPDGMRDRIKAAAKANKRSMNAEIVARLEESFSGRTARLDRESNRIQDRLERMEIVLRELSEMVSHERRRHHFILDTEDPSPDAMAVKLGQETFDADPEAPYNNPFPEGDSCHERFEYGFALSALRHLRSVEKVRERFPMIDVEHLKWAKSQPKKPKE